MGTWAAWLLNAAVAGAVAAALAFALRSRPGTELLRRVLAVVGGWSRGRAILVVLAVTAGTRLLLLPAFKPVDRADIEEYVAKAAAIAEDGHPRRQETRWDGSVFHRTLGWSLPLGGWYRLTGTRGVRSAEVFGVLIACGTSLLILRLGNLLGRDAEGRLAALAHALLVPQAMFALLPYAEGWTTFLVVAAALLHEQIRRGGRVPGGDAARGLLLGVVFGMIGITRTELAWLPVLSCALLLCERRLPALLPSALLLAGAFVPFAVNHEMRAGYPGHMRTSSQLGLILYFGNNPIDVNGHGNATREVADHVWELYAKDRTGALARDEALAWMRAHPGQVVLNAPKKAFHLWIGEPQGFGWLVREGEERGMPRTLSLPLRAIAWVQSLLLLFLGAAGWRLLGPERRLWTWTLLLHLAVWCLLAASPRNRLPLEPFLLFAAAAWVSARVAKAAPPDAGAGRLPAP